MEYEYGTKLEKAKLNVAIDYAYIKDIFADGIFNAVFSYKIPLSIILDLSFLFILWKFILFALSTLVTKVIVNKSDIF